MRTIYVVGLAGSGKTTIVSRALDLVSASFVTVDKPIPHVRHGDVWHLGRHRIPFGGTDTLAMNINPKACDWVSRLRNGAERDAPRVIVGEGDRLANNRFFSACPNLTIVWLDTPLEQARQQAASRAAQQGVPEQNASWWKGRVTRVLNIVNSRTVVRLDGARPISLNAVALKTMLVDA